MTASRSLPQTIPSDAELVLRTRAGDHEAYGTLMARYRQRLGRYAWYALGSRDDAEDALQDTFVRAFRALDQCTQPDQPLPLAADAEEPPGLGPRRGVRI